MLETTDRSSMVYNHEHIIVNSTVHICGLAQYGRKLCKGDSLIHDGVSRTVHDLKVCRTAPNVPTILCLQQMYSPSVQNVQ